MRPAQSMYVTREEWQSELIKWMNENPTIENQKVFMVFEGSVSEDHYIFEGTLLEFSNNITPVKTWEDVVAWAGSKGNILLIEDTEAYNEAVEFLELAQVGVEDEEDFYDEDGNQTPGGMFDAGGHLNGERYSEWADDIRDRRRGK